METSAAIEASLGGRYASALFELARDNRQIDTVEHGLRSVRDALRESDAFRQLTVNPLVGRRAAAAAVGASADVMGLDPLTKNFLGVLAENRRLAELPRIVQAFRQLAARHRGEVTAEVVSAHALTEDQVNTLKVQLRQRVGREVQLDLSVDRSLLGGLVVRIGSQMIDGSIRTRLDSLAHAMKG